MKIFGRQLLTAVTVLTLIGQGCVANTPYVRPTQAPIPVIQPQVLPESNTVPNVEAPETVTEDQDEPVQQAAEKQEPTTTNYAPNGTYTNVDGNVVPSPYYAPSAPAGASARCRDGTYSFSQNRRGTCSHHGGVAEWLY